MSDTADNIASAPEASAQADASALAAEAARLEARSLAADIVERGIQKNKPEFHEDLRWWYRFSVTRKLSDQECAEQLGIDYTTYYRVMRGTYVHPKTPGIIMAPPAKMLSRIRVLRTQVRDDARARNKGRVMTPTVQIIWQVCKKVAQDKLIGFIFGNSHIGKTAALLWYRDENNHGATIYVDLQGVGGEQEIYKEFARALGLGADTASHKLKQRVIDSIDRDTLVIVDEFHHITYAYQKGGSIRMVNALKSIKDRTGCAMVICATDVGREEIETGREKKLLEQLWRRGVIKRELPDALRVGDVRAIAGSFGLDVPEAHNLKDDTWKALRKHAPDFPGIDVCEKIAYSHGIEHLFSVFRDATALARKEGREVSWADVIDVQGIYDQQLIPDQV